MDHMVRNCMDQWKYELNLLKIEDRLYGKFQHETMGRIFKYWKDHSEDLMIIRKKGYDFYQRKCMEIKSIWFQSWIELYDHAQTKKSHIDQWIVERYRQRQSVHLEKWKVFASGRKTHRQQVCVIRECAELLTCTANMHTNVRK